MIARADAVVIGGGIMGASTAHFLTKLGFGEVALVEKRKICGGSTQYSAAHIRQYGSCGLGGHVAVGVLLNAAIVVLVAVYFFTGLDPIRIRP